jgi:hypothetical protein
MASQGIPTANILQPGVITTSSGVNRAIISNLQLLTPQYYSKYGQKYGTELYNYFFQWLATFDGMQEVKNQNFFWFESRGKNQLAVTNLNAVNAPAAGATVTINIPAGELYNDGTSYTPLRVGETVYVASSNIGGEILTVPTPDSATIRPKKSTEAFVSAGSANLLAGEILIFGGLTDVGEASTQYKSQTHLDKRYDNNITEIREEYAATDLAEMTDIYYSSGVTGDVINNVGQAGTSYFTYKSMVKTDVRYLNSIDSRLMRGDAITNTGLISATSVGTQGFIPKITADGETVNYTAGTLDIAKLHEITRIMKVNGCAIQNTWLQDIFQSQDFDDGIFKEYPAGAFVWGNGTNSEEASIAYGTANMKIDGILLQTKEYKPFNSEYQTGLTPADDYFRNYGIIAPNGAVPDARDFTMMKNVGIMYQTPPKGGTTGNGIRTWAYGGGSINATDGTMTDNVSYITYRGLRVVCANQFVIVSA